MGSFSIMHWLIVLVVVVLIFGTKKLGNVGSDLGKTVKGFKDGMNGTIEGEVKTSSTSLAMSDHTTTEAGEKRN